MITPLPVVDPEMATILAAARAAPPIDYPSLPIGEGRRIFEEMHLRWRDPPPPVAEIVDRVIAGPAGELRVRLYHPAHTLRVGAVLYLHGGGWTFGSVDTHDRILRLLARMSGAVVVGLDYRLAPEHPCPAGLEDTMAVLDWLAAGGAGGDVDPRRLALAGDSAGANLALAALLRWRDEARQRKLRTAALFYGCYVPEFDTPSHRRFGGGDFQLATARMQWYWRNYLGGDRFDSSGPAAPGRANLCGLPPLYLNAAGLDPLLNDTLALAARLAEAGVRYRLDVFPGVVHGFLLMTRELAAARAAITAGARHLAKHLTDAKTS